MSLASAEKPLILDQEIPALLGPSNFDVEVRGVKAKKNQLHVIAA